MNSVLYSRHNYRWSMEGNLCGARDGSVAVHLSSNVFSLSDLNITWSESNYFQQAGSVYIPFDWWQAFFFLHVDDLGAVALSNVSPIGGGDYTMTLDTIVPVKAGHYISLFWMNDEGCEIFGDTEQIFTHFTGEYLGSGKGFSILYNLKSSIKTYCSRGWLIIVNHCLSFNNELKFESTEYRSYCTSFNLTEKHEIKNHHPAVGTPRQPECQFVGQVFEYPGSCRLYWSCEADGTVKVPDLLILIFIHGLTNYNL